MARAQRSRNFKGQKQQLNKIKMPRKNKFPRKMHIEPPEVNIVIENNNRTKNSSVNSATSERNQWAVLQIPSTTVTTSSGDVRTMTEHTEQNNPSAPASDQAAAPTEEEIRAAKAARSRALDEELERLIKAVPDHFFPVPEEFQPMIEQLDIKNGFPQPAKFQFIQESSFEDEEMYSRLLLNPGPINGHVEPFQNLPHTMTYRHSQSMMTMQDNQAESEYAFNAVNELCAAMSEPNPYEGPSTSGYQYTQPNLGQGMPVVFQQEEPNFMMMEQVSQMIYPHVTIHMSTPVVLHTPTLRQLLSPSKMEPSLQPAYMPPQQPQQLEEFPLLQEFQQQQQPQQQQPQPPPIHPQVDTESQLPQRKDSPRELRNKAEKQRRDKLNQSIALLNKIVPPVVAMGRKIDKTTIMKLTAHYLRSHQYVFGNSINNGQTFNVSSVNALLSLLKGFVLTVTYRGIIVVVSHNIRQMLGYSELDLIGTNVFSLVHEQDHEMFRDHLTPKSVLLGKHGELLIPDEPDGAENVAIALAKEKKTFVLRFKKLVHRSEPPKYMMCHVEGSFRKSDRASRILTRCCQLVRRARARGENPRSSGNDVVFVGVVRPLADTFMSESVMESFRMEYRTRHSVDGEIIQCEQRIALVTGYMTHEVSGINAMNFMHRDDVRWVIIALRDMYDQHRLFGESCYRLMTRNGEFVYMRSRGRLDVDANSKIATSFVCTNTVVDEEEGKHFINQMKKRFTILVENGASSLFDRDESEPYDEKSIPVEDPRLLEKVILHLVTNLPSPDSGDSDSEFGGYQRVSIIPPKKERIVNAIKRIEKVLHPKRRSSSMDANQGNQNSNKNEKPNPANEKRIRPIIAHTRDVNSRNVQYSNTGEASLAQASASEANVYRQPYPCPTPSTSRITPHAIQPRAPPQYSYDRSNLIQRPPRPNNNQHMRMGITEESAQINFTGPTQSQSYRHQYGIPTQYVRPFQVYGTPSTSAEAVQMITRITNQYNAQMYDNVHTPLFPTYNWGVNAYDQPSTSSAPQYQYIDYNDQFNNYNTSSMPNTRQGNQWLDAPNTAVDEETHHGGVEVGRVTPFVSDLDSDVDEVDNPERRDYLAPIYSQMQQQTEFLYNTYDSEQILPWEHLAGSDDPEFETERTASVVSPPDDDIERENQENRCAELNRAFVSSFAINTDEMSQPARSGDKTEPNPENQASVSSSNDAVPAQNKDTKGDRPVPTYNILHDWDSSSSSEVELVQMSSGAGGLVMPQLIEESSDSSDSALPEAMVVERRSDDESSTYTDEQERDEEMANFNEPDLAMESASMPSCSEPQHVKAEMSRRETVATESRKRHVIEITSSSDDTDSDNEPAKKRCL